MNFFNLIIISLIFLSLAIIVVVFGRSLSRVKNIDISGLKPKIKIGKRSFASRFFVAVSGGLKALLVSIAEWIVRKIKKVLHLIHFWLIKVKKKKSGNGITDDIEAKKELILQEEANLDTVINEDSGDFDDERRMELETKVILGLSENHELEQKVSVEIGDRIEGKKISIDEEKERKIAKFFSWKKKKEEVETVDLSEGKSNFLNEVDESVEYEESELDSQSSVDSYKEKSSFWSKIKNKLAGKKRKPESDFDNYQEEDVSNKFSDGVVRINKPLTQKPKEEFLIKEVVRAGRNTREPYDVDDELGVDRKILEKKILQKIAKEPKNIEHYRQLGELYIKMKSFDDANDTYKFILKMTPRDADARRKIEKIKLLKRLN